MFDRGCQVYAAVRRYYKYGISGPQEWIVGQLDSNHDRERAVLRLWPLDWAAHKTSWRGRALAELWNPLFLGVANNHVVFTGLEARGDPPRRQWFAQRWSCEFLTASHAHNYFKGAPTGLVLPTPGIPPSPAADAEAPFD
jgi:hypothetical protein